MKLWKAMGDVSEGTEVRCSRGHASFLPIQDKREEHAKFKPKKKKHPKSANAVLREYTKCPKLREAA
jgi:hypothetical protein